MFNNEQSDLHYYKKILSDMLMEFKYNSQSICCKNAETWVIYTNKISILINKIDMKLEEESPIDFTKI